jgi:ubiquinone/menaquinone biosynthesis C-methylase UbiE
MNVQISSNVPSAPGRRNENTYSPQDIKKSVENSYDAIAPRYLQWSSPSHNIRLHYMDQLLSHLTSKESMDVLDLGCGAGVPCTQLLASRPNIQVTGCDIPSTQLALAAERLPAGKFKLIRSDMMSLEFADSTFDAVVAFYSIIHVPREEQSTLLKRVGKWLKPGGWFLANFVAEGAEEVIEQQWLGEAKGWMFWSGWDPHTSAAMVKEAGLELRINTTAETVEKDALGAGIIKVLHLWILAQKPEEEIQ